jgi:prepilin-type N-terminal cleavage/methylation domain-containing protein
MKSGSAKSGFTLIEMLAVVAIIAILVAMVVGLTKRINDQGKERLCRDTLELIGNALEQFRDFGYEYQNTNYSGLAFPLDCNGFTVQGFPRGLELTLREALYPSTAIVTVDINQIEPPHDRSFSGSEALYFCLRQVPDCRITLDKIDKSLLTNKGIDKVTDITITITSGAVVQTYPFMRIVDPWGKTLRYDYYDVDTGTLLPILNTKKTFPIITSAGPDGKFDTADDIINRQPK